MNVLSRTLAVRSASTCPAATSVIVRRATRSTLWAGHARLNQVMLKQSPPIFTLKSSCLIWQLSDGMTCGFVILSEISPDPSSLFCVLQVLCPPSTSPIDTKWGRLQWTAGSTSVWFPSWRTSWLWTWTCLTRWSSGLTCPWRKFTGLKDSETFLIRVCVLVKDK